MTRSVPASLSRRGLLRGAAVAGPAASHPAWQCPALVQRTPVTEDTFAEGVTRTRDVVYGDVDGTTLMLDVLHPPAREAPRPAVVILHGGGLIGGDRTMGVEAGTYLAQAGYVAFSVG